MLWPTPGGPSAWCAAARRNGAIDPARVGVMGFSAGGELAILAGTKFEAGKSDASDPIDRLSSRPDFLMLIYPGMRQAVFNVTKDTPPTFLAVADDDKRCAGRFASRFIRR